MPRAIASKDCFACGTENPHGFRMRIFPDGEAVRCTFIPPPHLRGFSRVAHGGVHAVLLDEAIGVAVSRRMGIKAVTVELGITYRRPMFVGAPVTVRAWLDRGEGRLLRGAGEIRDAEGRVLAEGRARVVALDERLAASFVGRKVVLKTAPRGDARARARRSPARAR